MVRVLQSYCNLVSTGQRYEKIIAQAQKGSRPARTSPLPKSNKQFRPDDVGAILTAWHDGNNITAITRLLGFDHGTIRKYLHAAGIDTSTNPTPNQRDRDIIRLHGEGKSMRQIGAVVGCAHSTAALVIRKHQQAQAAVS